MRSLRINERIHQWTNKSFQRVGFQWEERRLGESRLGLWRVPLRRAMPPVPARKRIVFLPGFGDTPLSWLGVLTGVMPYARKHYDELILADFPGFGGFLSHDPAFATLDSMMLAVGDLLDDLRPHALLGHSLGGWLVGNYAWECSTGIRPTRKSGRYSGPRLLVPIAAAGVAGSPDEREQFRAIFEKALNVGFNALRPHVFGSEPFWFRLMAAEFEKFLERPEITQFVRSAEDRHSLESKIKDIRSDIRVIWGDRDTLTPTSWSKIWIKESGEKASGLWIPKTGHSPQIESPLMTTAALALALGYEPRLPPLKRAMGRLLLSWDPSLG
jgi:pimeloyl-ACP methyl ester carboxylesterase